ncbi:hypothetical protein JAAARDRAFT_125793 [Jaapia argillacea MUCL 33604]|uniref:Uncharacterized protein n=1 Tax=Jaapia argillacea MUCL 33604 TaxID=933084 RepID=A0A067PZQ3_9AGAM|nr:hypothetical protein JAAARDRAFT_125793 [Jaapia argillacea MUCL 33604]
MRRKQAAWEREKQERLEREREEAERRRQQRLHDIRQLREAARAVLNATHASRTKDQFELHDRKWTAIKDNAVDVECIAFEHIPWPVLDVVVTTPAEITRARIEQFVFHPMRTGVDGKSRKERVRADLLKWHPDKFNSKVMGKTSEWERDMVTEAAGFVAKTLTQLLSEEVARERA